MLRNRFDQFGKNILHDTFRHHGQTQTEAEVPPGDAQRIDLWFIPDETRARGTSRFTGVLAAVARAPAFIELWSKVPEEKEFNGCLRKRYAWHHVLELREKREWTMPPLWGISAGRPDALLGRFGFEPAPEGPAGHYQTAAPGWQARMVVVGELPRVRDTILLRLLGHPPVRRQALEELKALPEGAWEREVALPWLMRLKLDLEAADPTTLSPEDKEIAMDMQEWFKEFERDLKAKTVEEVTPRILEKGRQEGLEPLVHLFERRLARPLTASERAILVERLREQGAERLGDVVLDLSPEDLATWLAATNGH
ncbi:hypothetical protein [Polyangium aurulentum]|uniref:hypothetical protein n=1 Tax=Polyangium aurulentum TaxID=2567896 RepID=UPI0010AEC2FB|nr:hypothetical protein [Polyangium aurulentum]UQA58384.1 hypothetical protein E8A73_045260 [Polyangium aurulentum]